jgi:hypothetical protein
MESQCPGINRDIWTCHFLPFTNCTLPEEFFSDTEASRASIPTKLLGTFDVPTRFRRAWETDRVGYAQQVKEQKVLNHVDLMWYRYQLFRFVLRPNYQMRKKIAEYNMTQDLGFYGKKCLAMHVR